MAGAGYRRNRPNEGTKIYNRRKSLDSIKELMVKNPAKAKSELSRHLNENPDDMYAWFYYGKICLNESYLDEAEYAYTKVAYSTSRNKYAGITGLGDVARLRGENETAKKYYRRSIAENPTEQAPTYFILARLETTEGNFDEALRILSRLRPSNAVQIEKIRIYSEAGEKEKALQISESIIPETPQENRSLAFERAKLAIASEDYLKAKYYLAEAKEYNVKDDEYYKILAEEARLALELGDFQLAVDNCEECLAANHTSHGFNYLTLGLAKQSQGKYKNAIDCYKLGKSEPAVSYLPKSGCSYFLGCLEIIMGEEEFAEKHLKESIIPNVPPRFAVIEILINLYIKQGRAKEGKDLLDYVRNNNSDYYTPEQITLCEMLLDKAMGNPLKNFNPHSYRDKQIFAYDKSLAVEHIKKNHQISDPTAGNFSPSIDIEVLIDEIVPQLVEDNITIVDTMDRYFIDYPNAGISKDGELADKICVVTFPGTKDILTMYPEVSSKLTTKRDIIATMGRASERVNRIDSFNKRFANFTPPKK